MRKFETIKVYTLVNANGKYLRLELGRITEGLRDEYPFDTKDKGYRWRFIGKEIPMPVRSMYWFNGFDEPIMLNWLKGNGWVPRVCVYMCNGTATVYELPSAECTPEPEHTAREMYNKTVSIALEKCMKEIKKAKEDGRTSCYVYSTMGKPPVEAIETLLNAGYDITYTSFGKGYGDWFVKAYWDRPKSKGKIFVGDILGADAEVTIDDYKNA